MNFLGEQNYIVTTMECYKDLIADRNSGKLLEHIRECNPESSRHYGIMVAIPESRKEWDDLKILHHLQKQQWLESGDY